MAWTYHYGSSASTGSSTYRCFLRTEVTSWGINNYTLKYQYGIQVTAGNFQGSLVNTSWLGNYTVPLNGTGYTGWGTATSITLNYGATKAFSANASYTGGSGTVYKTTLSYTWPAQYPTVGFYSSSGKWKNAIPYVYSGGGKPCVACLWSTNGYWKLCKSN